jgi:hypothetical protein
LSGALEALSDNAGVRRQAEDSTLSVGLMSISLAFTWGGDGYQIRSEKVTGLNMYLPQSALPGSCGRGCIEVTHCVGRTRSFRAAQTSVLRSAFCVPTFMSRHVPCMRTSVPFQISFFSFCPTVCSLFSVLRSDPQTSVLPTQVTHNMSTVLLNESSIGHLEGGRGISCLVWPWASGVCMLIGTSYLISPVFSAMRGVEYNPSPHRA